MPRKKGNRSAAIAIDSTNSTTAKQGSSIYSQNLAIAPLRLAEFDNNKYSSRSRDNCAFLFERLAEEIVHQVGNPLCALKGFITLASQQEKGLPVYLPLIEQEISHIEDTLKLFSIIAGSQYELSEILDLRELLAETVSRFTPQAIGRGVWVTLPYPVQPIMIKANPDRMSVAIRQLLNNALEASNCGDVIDIRLVKKNRQVTLSITNSSSEPLPPELARGFKPFFTTKSGHAGLGLWLAHRVANSYEGCVKIEDRDHLITASLSLPLI